MTGCSGAIQTISKYSMMPDADDADVYVDPNANLFNQDHNGLDVPFTSEKYVELNKEDISFTNKLQIIFANALEKGEVQNSLQMAEESGYVVVVDTDSAEDFTKASNILNASH